ncbi:MAG: TetR/AcrR family transcriptional regulator [Tetrasphaera sp.]
MSPETGVRAANRARMEERILRLAGQHLARDGAAALSLRAIARDLGVASSAVYRYVDSRDELLTRLIVAAYDSLGDAVDAALAGVDDPAHQFGTIARTLRTWALAHPEQYALIYGSPVPGYAAPSDRTNPAGTRITTRLLQALVALPVRAAPAVAPLVGTGGIGALLDDARVEALGIGALELTLGLAAWDMVRGALTSEVFGQYGAAAFSDPAAHFEVIVALAGALVGIDAG